MQPHFITFKKFNDAALAFALTNLFEENGIEYYTEEVSLSFDPSFARNRELAIEYQVKISPDDFTRATALLNKSEAEDIKQVSKDYYLFTFTNEELMEILEKADEWSSFDHQLARKLLAERGVDISDDTLAGINQKREAELRVPEPPQSGWIIVGYICALAGGILGLFIGWHLTSHKKTLPDGEQVYEYKENDRKHGRNILYLSIIAFVVSVVYKLMAITA